MVSEHVIHDDELSRVKHEYSCGRVHIMRVLHTRYPVGNLWVGGYSGPPPLPAPLAYSLVKCLSPILETLSLRFP